MRKQLTSSIPLNISGIGKLFFSLCLTILFILPGTVQASGSENSKNKITNTTEVLSSGDLLLQSRQVSGIVTDAETGDALIGVNIVVEGSTTGVITNVKGEYIIMVSDPAAVLVFSYIGYETLKVPAGTNTILNVTMALEASELEELVVVGYGTQKKVSTTGAITTVSATEIVKSPVSSINNALAGRAAGVVTIQSTSRPGYDFAEIFIRGRATTGDTNPLILVDGIERDITRLDPNEVESINVLKDASATAVYGVRGANGVIIVTTKSGQLEAKPQITFTANYGMQGNYRIPRLLPATEYMKMYNAKMFTDATNKSTFVPQFTGEMIEKWRAGDDPIFYPDINWFDYIVDDYAPTSQQNLNISGGSKKMKYFVSLGHYHAEGFFSKADFMEGFRMNDIDDRYNIRVNADFNWTKNFSTSLKVATQISEGSGTQGGMQEALNNAFSNAPIVGQPIVNGLFIRGTQTLEPYKSIEYNPFQVLYSSGQNIRYNSRSNVDLTARYKLDDILKGLSVRAKFAYDNYYAQTAVLTRGRHQVDIVKTPPGQGFEGNDYAFVYFSYDGNWSTTESFSQNVRLYSEAAMEYNNTIEGGHTIGGLVLGTMERRFAGGSPALPYNYMGIVGRATYNFRAKYMFEFNMGYNGSENFRVGKQFGFFPSFSGGYVISEENFFPKNDVLTFMKLRGSWGLVGNDKIGGSRFPYTPGQFTTSGTYWFGTTGAARSGYLEGAIGNPDIGWETSEKADIALELKFFKNQLTFSGDLFKENRTGIFGKYLNVPYTFGDITKLPSFNLGEVENKGYELELGFKSKSNREFNYWLSGNYSFARNKRVYFDEIPQTFKNLTATGYPIGQPYKLEVIGWYTNWDEINDPARPKSIWEGNTPLQPGDFKYRDVTGDGIINTNDRLPIGYSNVPEIFYGITAGLSYKNFDISILVQGAANVQTEYGAATFGFGGYGAINDITYNQWTMERYLSGDYIKYPRLTNVTNGAHSFQSNSAMIEDASYIRLKNLEIGYSFEKGIINRFGMKSLRPYINGQNLLTYSPMHHWDPETIRGEGAIDRAKYPVSRVFNFGVRANF